MKLSSKFKADSMAFEEGTEAALAVADQAANLPAVHLETPPVANSAESVKFDLEMAKKHGALTLAYLARAGWTLVNEKQTMGHGAWMKWCEDELGIGYRTADRYIKFYYSTVGEHLRAQGTAHRLVENLTDSMIEEALSGLESKTATGAMIELGIVKRPAGWGGTREGAGRKARGVEDECRELDEIANNPALLFAAIKGPLDEIWKLHRERDVFARLGDHELADVVGVLQPLYKYSAGVLEDRMREPRKGKGK